MFLFAARFSFTHLSGHYVYLFSDALTYDISPTQCCNAHRNAFRTVSLRQKDGETRQTMQSGDDTMPKFDVCSYRDMAYSHLLIGILRVTSKPPVFKKIKCAYQWTVVLF